MRACAPSAATPCPAAGAALLLARCLSLAVTAVTAAVARGGLAVPHHAQGGAEGVALSNVTEVAPGVAMPTVNLGGVSSRPSNYSLFLQVGGRGLDTALTYGVPTQTAVGQAVAASTLPRGDVFVTTKVPCCPQPLVGGMCKGYPAQPSAKRGQADIAADLDQLGLKQVDLLLLHWPCSTIAATLATYRGMEAALKAGKARAIGVSNFNASYLEALSAAGLTKPAVNQCGFSVGVSQNASDPESRELGRNVETLEYCNKHGIVYQAYSPLGGLSNINVLGDVDVLAVAKAHGVSSAQVALRWIVQQGAMVVTAAMKGAYMSEDLSLFHFELSQAEMATLSAK